MQLQDSLPATAEGQQVESEESDSDASQASSRDSQTSDGSLFTRGVSKSGREIKQVQFYGNPVPSSLSRLFYSEHDAIDFNNVSIECQEAIVHPELLDQSRKNEILGWREYGVYQEVKRGEIIGKGKKTGNQNPMDRCLEKHA